MTMTFYTPQLLERASRVLPASSDELLLRGIMAETTDRIVALKQASLRLRAQHDSFENLEQKIKAVGVSPDDHRLYTDLLEWRAIHHELAELVELLETL
jgi:hypothetical protein